LPGIAKGAISSESRMTTERFRKEIYFAVNACGQVVFFWYGFASGGSQMAGMRANAPYLDPARTQARAAVALVPFGLPLASILSSIEGSGGRAPSISSKSSLTKAQQGD
jgi:hypothetical protein